jgi:signal transduction histidine kinase
MGEGFVGRQRELSALERLNGELRRARGCVCLLAGLQGMGKSRLAEELAREAAAADTIVAWGRCWEVGGAPSYWTWGQVLSELAGQLDANALRPRMGDGARYVAQLAPDFFADVEPAADESAQAQFRLFEAVALLLRTAARQAPLLLIFDDLHAADRPSLLLLQFVARSLRSSPVGILGTYRPEALPAAPPEVGAELSRVAREGTTVSLDPLTQAEVGTLLEAELGHAVANDVARSVFSASEGSPLFVTEFAQLLRREGHLESAVVDGLPLPIPVGIADVIRERVAQLQPEERKLLELAATTGRDFNPAMLASALGLSGARVLTQLGTAAQLGLVAAAGKNTWRFGHVLFRESLYRALTPERRTELHLEVANALEAVATDASDDDGAQLAHVMHHLLEAVPLTSTERLAKTAIRSARASIRRTAFEDAAGQLTRVLELLGDAPEPTLHGELLVLLANAQIRADWPSECKRTTEAAVELARDTNDAQLLIRVALQYGAEFSTGRTDQLLVDLLDEGLSLLSPGDSGTRALALSRLAAARQPSREPQREIAAAEEAIAMARRVGDADVLRDVLYTASATMVSFAHPKLRLPIDRETVTAARLAGDVAQELRSLLRLCFDCYEYGQIEESEALATEFAKRSGELNLPHYSWQAPMMAAMYASLRGDFSAADRQLERSVTAGNTNRFGLIWERVARWSSEGRIYDATQYEPPSDGSHSLPQVVFDSWMLSSAIAYTRMGDLEGAKRTLGRVSDWIVGPGRLPMAMGWMGEVCHFVGDQQLAATVLKRIEVYRDCWLTGGIPMFFFEGPFTRPIALLEATLGNYDEAATLLEATIAALTPVRALPFIARSEHELAEVLLARGGPGDAERARELLDSVQRSLESLPMPGLAKRLEPLVASLASSPSPRARMSSVKPERETSTLSALAAGIAHEINSPLAAIRSSSELAQRAMKIVETALEEAGKAGLIEHQKKVTRALRALESIQQVTPEATERIERVVSQLKSFAHLDRAEIDEVDLRQCIDEVLALLAHRCVGRIAIERDYQDVPPLRCDVQRVNDALMNILATCVESISGEGAISVSTKRDGDRIVASIADTGAGFAPDVVGRLFEPTLDARGSAVGMNLRLPIAGQVLAEHGGSISVTSELGAGATYELRFPLSAPA